MFDKRLQDFHKLEEPLVLLLCVCTYVPCSRTEATTQKKPKYTLCEYSSHFPDHVLS